MGKYTATAFGALFAGLLFMAPQEGSAAPGEHLNWGHQLNAGDEACPSGDKVLNISYKINNSLDSGTGKNDDLQPWWAYIDYVLQVNVVELDTGEFCATVKNQGSFESVGGDGPGCHVEANCGLPAGRLEAGVVGTFQGGFTETFNASFVPGGEKTRGSIGSFDQNCDAATGICDGPGISRWLSLYFDDVNGFNYDEWWGWVYHAGNNGSWVNAIDGNTGNIIGE